MDLKCQVKNCSENATCRVEKMVSRMSSSPNEDYLVRVHVSVCSVHSRLLAFGHRELLLPLNTET